jgi:hypothetical protein
MRVQMQALVPHTTHESDGRQVSHDEGSTYEVEDFDVANLEGLGFARRVTSIPDEGGANATAPSPAPPPPKTPAPKRPKS